LVPVMEPFEKLSLELDTSEGKTLILADLHIAFELTKGLRVRTYFERQLAEFIKSKGPDLVVLLGDIKEPLSLRPFTKKLLLEFFTELEDFKIWITKGNHDGNIEEIAREFSNVEVEGHFLDSCRDNHQVGVDADQRVPLAPVADRHEEIR